MQNFPLRLQHPAGALATRDESRFLVALVAPQHPTAAPVKSTLSSLGLTAEESAGFNPTASPQAGNAASVRLNNSSDRIWTRTLDGRSSQFGDLSRAIQAAAATTVVRSVSAVYSTEAQGRREYFSPLADVVLIEFIRGDLQLATKIAEFTTRFGLVEDSNYSPMITGFRSFRVKDPLGTHSLEILDRINKEKPTVVRNARFVTMPMIIPTAYEPNDELYEQQWNMERIRAGGSGQTAWNLHRGSPSITIAILDEGCDLTHPDLVNQYASTGINLGTMSGDGGPTGNHGTACAGIVAAAIDNSVGVTGLAGKCRLLPIAFDAWTDQEVAAGIRYAADHGARVINMSFGWNLWDPAIVAPAIQYAFDRNVVMCVATHNHDGPITFPATNPLVIACGASGRDDNRKSRTSPDGEPGWGSNFGPEIAVVAPGIQIPTTDIQGSQGYVGGDYRMDFNGTSAATPHVSGLAALLAAQDSSRTNVEIRAIIETTADKVGGQPYAASPDHRNGLWNEHMGYGRINARAALSYSSRTPVGSGSTEAARLLELVSHLERALASIRSAVSRFTEA